MVGEWTVGEWLVGKGMLGEMREWRMWPVWGVHVERVWGMQREWAKEWTDVGEHHAFSSVVNAEVVRSSAGYRLEIEFDPTLPRELQ